MLEATAAADLEDAERAATKAAADAVYADLEQVDSLADALTVAPPHDGSDSDCNTGGGDVGSGGGGGGSSGRRRKATFVTFDTDAGPPAAKASYRTDGRKTFYNPTNQLQRSRVRESEAVRLWIEKYWLTFRSVKDFGALAKDEYVAVQQKICKALFEEGEFSVAEADAAIANDWREIETHEHEHALEEARAQAQRAFGEAPRAAADSGPAPPLFKLTFAQFFESM